MVKLKMKKTNLFRNDPSSPIPEKVIKTKGVYFYLKNGKKIMDLTGGNNSHAIVGFSHSKVLSALKKQMKKFTHIDYKGWTDENLLKLSELLCSKANHGLDKVYFCGNSGAEACEAALRMSYQIRYDAGHKNKKWFISRAQSYHGATGDAMSLGERPNLEFFRHTLSPFRSQISMHHPLYLKTKTETLDEYARRSAKELEDKILEIGAENVCAFVGETIMGGLVGDVPPAPNYWKYIRKICDKYDVHLILDEVYCGTGSSGKIYCCDWDKVRPDFIFIGKTLAAGYGALSAVITSSKVESNIKKFQGRLQHTTTYQGHSLSAAGALAVQKIVHNDKFLLDVQRKGKFMMNYLKDSLVKHDFYRDVRGRGMRFSFEYDCNNRDNFSLKLGEIMLRKHNIFLSCKFHRICFTPSLTMTFKEAEFAINKIIKEFNELSRNWNKKKFK